jgi:ankyrin repeat protein
LLDHGALINALHYQDEIVGGPKTVGMGTPLHTAAYFGNEEAVRHLLWKGADKSIGGRYGKAIDIARNKGRTIIVQIFCNKSHSIVDRAFLLMVRRTLPKVMPLPRPGLTLALGIYSCPRHY